MWWNSWRGGRGIKKINKQVDKLEKKKITSSQTRLDSFIQHITLLMHKCQKYAITFAFQSILIESIKISLRMFNRFLSIKRKPFKYLRKEGIRVAIFVNNSNNSYLSAGAFMNYMKLQVIPENRICRK
jgi:hypothetical protein